MTNAGVAESVGRPMTKEQIADRNKETVNHIAYMCHEANRAFCRSQGDESQSVWAQAPEWQQESAVNGVLFALNNPHATPEDSHENWYREKFEAGWKYGATKDPDKKEHPCMVAYRELPYEQQMKDSIFQGIARSMLKKAIASGRIIVERVPTDGEEVMNVQFNPGGNPSVDRIKRSFADLHDLLIRESDQHRNVILNREGKKWREAHPEPLPGNTNLGMPLPPAVNRMGRAMALALTNIETAQMYSVKAVTR